MEAAGVIVMLVVLLAGCSVSALVANILGFRAGRRIGQREGFQKYLRQLRFEPREEYIPIEPTDQPHARNPKGRARVSEAHMSQPRRVWTE